MIDSLGAIVEAFNAKTPQLDSVANNIANLHTYGFKAEKSYLKFAEEAGQKNVSYKSAHRTDFSPGTLHRTGNPLDAAIQGDGFFAIDTKDGEAYTRKGNFTVNRNNELMTLEGDYVLGEGERIVLTGKQVQISQTGEIKTESGVIGKLKIVSFGKQDELVKAGAGLFRNPENKGVLKPGDKAEVRGEHLEMSNVEVLKEMVELIDVQRTVESYQKVIQTLGDFDRLSTNRLGRLS